MRVAELAEGLLRARAGGEYNVAVARRDIGIEQIPVAVFDRIKLEVERLAGSEGEILQRRHRGKIERFRRDEGSFVQRRGRAALEHRQLHAVLAQCRIGRNGLRDGAGDVDRALEWRLPTAYRI